MFVPLASASPDLSHILPTKIEHKSVILPYGYHTDWLPVESRLCDMPTCPEPNADKPWSRFDGCWHSFHVACLQGSSICEICRGHIKRDITKLAKIASDAIFNPAVGSDNNDDANDEGATDISNTVINAVNFPFEKPEQSDTAIVADHKSLEAEIKDTLVTAPGKNAVIVIVPMDKSMLLCSNDSHII